MPQIFLHDLFKPLVTKLERLKKVWEYTTVFPDRTDELIGVLIETFSNDINPYKTSTEPIQSSTIVSNTSGWIPCYSGVDGSIVHCSKPAYKGGDKLSIGDYAKADNIVKGVIYHFEEAGSDILVYVMYEGISHVSNINAFTKVTDPNLIRSKGKPITEWEGSFVFDRPIDFNYAATAEPKYNSYVNTKTGEKFSVGDYVEVLGKKGKIIKFVVDHTGSVFINSTIDSTINTCVYAIGMFKKIPLLEIWLHKPSQTKYKIIESGPTVTYCELKHIGGDIVHGATGTFPVGLLDNSQDWVKL